MGVRLFLLCLHKLPADQISDYEDSGEVASVMKSKSQSACESDDGKADRTIV
jgi:hypothetical protein